MTGITVLWTDIDESVLGVGRPITRGLKLSERDNTAFLMQWLGGSYIAGAVQNHDHDGINSAPIEALPNLIKNGSFERDGGGGVPAGWVFSAYTGGSAAIVTATQRHGRACVGITSTVLANGGGYYESANYFEVGGGEDYLWKIWRQGSVVNISSRAEIIWYDSAEAQISVSTLFNVTATETTFTEVRGRIAAPTTARLAKLRLTGGVPGAGSAVGTVRFDGVMIPDFPRIDTTSIQLGGVGQAAIGAAAVGQTQLKSTTASQSLALNSAGDTGVINPPGGSYTINWFLGGAISYVSMRAHGSTYAASVGVHTSTSSQIAYLYSRYIQASPPYDLGDGDIPLFVFVLVDNATRKIVGTYAAPDAPWHNNGPTDCRAEFYDTQGRGWRWQDVTDTIFAPEDLSDYIGAARAAGWRRLLREEQSVERLLLTGTRDTFTDGIKFSAAATWGRLCAEQRIDVQRVFGDAVPQYVVVGREQVEVTQAIKQQDMHLIPHPFSGTDLIGRTVVMLDPVAENTIRLAEYAAQGVSISQLLHEDFLRIDNYALDRSGPPGVMVVPYRWKLT